MPKTLLLADDSITIQRVVGITFANEDFEITTVDNGEDAVQKAKELKPHIILADVIMPKKNGYEVCQAIRSDPTLRATPVLLLAGTFEAFDENRARAVGANGHITKPFESQALIDKVNGLLNAGAVQAPLGAAQPVRGVVQPQPMTPWNGSSMTQGRPIPAPMPSAFGQPPRPTVPGATAPGPRPFSTGPQTGPGYAPGMPGAPRPLTPQSVPQPARPITQPMASAPRPLATPSAQPPSFVSQPSVVPSMPRVAVPPIPTAIPPVAAIPATPSPASRLETTSASAAGVSKPLDSALFEESGASEKVFESQPLEPSTFESDSSVILEPEPLEPETLEPEPASLESADETGRSTFKPLATGSDTQGLDTLESLDVEGVDTWGAKEDITKPIPTLMAPTGSDRKVSEKRLTTEPLAKPEMISADVEKPMPIEPAFDNRGMDSEPAITKRLFEAKPLRTESLPEVLPADNIELPSVDIEEELLADQVSGTVSEVVRSAPTEKVERSVPREEKFKAPPVREAPIAPFEVSTAAAIAASKIAVAAEAAVDKPVVPQLSKSEIEAIARETIEKVVWEVVPQLAEVILREEIEKLVREKLSE
jgi:CheY-like chemotaxis protein